MQEDIENIVLWAGQNQLAMAFHKCSVLHLGFKNEKKIYSVNENVKIPAAENVKDLGITISSSLNFSEHIEKITAKARRMVGLIFRTFSCRDAEFLTQMFCTFARPILEYNTTIWSPSGLENIKKIERVQRAFVMDMSPCPSTFLKICQFCTVLKHSRFCLFSFQIFVSAFFNFHFQKSRNATFKQISFQYIFLLESLGGLARNILARLQFRN